MSQEKIEFSPEDPQWTDKILSLMTDTEKHGGKPKFGGLRRMVELVLGRVVYTNVELVTSPNKENDYTAACKYTMRVHGHDGVITEWSDVADAHYNNVGVTKSDKEKFSAFVTAVASTRSKTRVMRDALALQCVTADEMPKDVDSLDAADFEGMSDAQSDTLKTILRRIKIKYEDFIFNETGYKEPEKVSRQEAALLIKKANKLQQSEN